MGRLFPLWDDLFSGAILVSAIHPKDAEIIPREGIYTCWNPSLGIRFGTLKTPIGPGMDPGMRFGFLASYSIYSLNFWLVVSTPLKNMSQMGIFPNFRGENKTYLSYHHPDLFIAQLLIIFIHVQILILPTAYNILLYRWIQQSNNQHNNRASGYWLLLPTILVHKPMGASFKSFRKTPQGNQVFHLEIPFRLDASSPGWRCWQSCHPGQIPW